MERVFLRDSHVMGESFAYITSTQVGSNSSPKVTSGSFAFESANITALQVYHATGVVFFVLRGEREVVGVEVCGLLLFLVVCLLFVVHCCVVVCCLLYVVGGGCDACLLLWFVCSSFFVVVVFPVVQGPSCIVMPPKFVPCTKINMLQNPFRKTHLDPWEWY